MDRGCYKNDHANYKNHNSNSRTKYDSHSNLRHPSDTNRRLGREVVSRMPGVPDIKLGK